MFFIKKYLKKGLIKKHFYTAFFLCCFVISSIYGQTPKLDSLKGILKNAKHDTTRLRALYNILLNSFGEEKKTYAIQFYDLAKKSIDKKENQDLKNKYLHYYASSITGMGNLYYEQGETKKALEYYHQSSKINETVKDEQIEAKNSMNIGNVYQKLGNFPIALKYYNHGLKLHIKNQDKKSTAIIITNIGSVYTALGNLTKALDCFLKALKIHEEMNNKKQIASSLHNIGYLYLEKGDSRKSLEYTTKALKIREELQDKLGLVSSFSNIGLAYNNLGEFKKALYYYQKSLKISQEHEYNMQTAYSYINIGTIYEKQGENSKALENYYKSLEMCQKTENKLGIISSCYHIGKNYFKKNDLLKALNYAQKSFNQAQESGFVSDMEKAAKLLSDIYKKQNKIEKAFEMYDVYIKMQDSIKSQKVSNKMESLITNFENEKKEQQIVILSKENNIQHLKLTQNKYNLIALLIGFIIITLVILVFIRNQKLTNKNKIIEIEQKLLRQQMNPHFIFNSLNAIRLYLYTNTPYQVAKYLAKYAKLLRMILESSKLDYISISKEIKALEYYMDLQKLRFKDKFIYDIKMDPFINPEIITIPPLFALPFIENFIENGLNEKNIEGKIKIHYILKDNMIVIEVEDNGLALKKLDQIKNENKLNVLVANITEERITEFNKNNKQKIIWSIEQLKNNNQETHGCKITFTIPYVKLTTQQSA